MQRVLIFTPTRGWIQPTTAVSMVTASALLGQARIQMEWRVKPGCFVHVMRDRMAREFLESDYTDLLFLDDDIGFNTEGLIGMLRRDVDVVGAIIPKRSGDGEMVINRLGDADERGLIPCAYIGCGLLRMTRQAIATMADSWPYIFDAPRDGDSLTGEDVDFCYRYRKTGGEVWADPNVQTTHTGPNTWNN